MQTRLADFIRGTPEGQEADAILRKCVHCGFCTATCPTYQLLGDELDGPRGRIYLIKQVLEGARPTERTLQHLDRCLTCRACETTCPSGVHYSRLADIGRSVVERRVRRPLVQRLLRRALRTVLPYPHRFGPLLRMGQMVRPLLPAPLRAKTPRPRRAPPRPDREHGRRMLVLDGCAQPGIAPEINAHAARVLDRLGIRLQNVAGAGCCGAVSYHLNAQEEGLDFMRRNVDAWWPSVQDGAEAIVMTASGCGAMVKEYGHLLAHDAEYAERAARISELCTDLSEILAREDLDALPTPPPRRVAFHSPCTLQHGQGIRGVVEDILRRAGHQLTEVADAHLCCGSAGTYSILQPTLSHRLLNNKLQALECPVTGEEPELIATANIGCLAHLDTASSRPVVHWISLLDTDAPAPG
jgi:glycolate oxidase iron-sulfur subunit